MTTIPAISILIPFFNPGDAFVPMLQALVEQEGLEWAEFVLVDDASSDSSAAQAKAFVEKAKAAGASATLISLAANKGPATARREALRASSAPFVLYLDADDIPAPTLLATLLPIAKANDAPDAVIFGYDFLPPAKAPKMPAECSQQSLISLILRAEADSYLFNKMLARRLFSDSGAWCPPNIRLWDDKAILVPLLTQARSIATISQILYHYRLRRPGSITAATTERLDDMPAALSHIESYLRASGLFSHYERALSCGKLRLKLLLLWASKGRKFREYAALYNDIDPAVLDDSDVKGHWEYALTAIRMGSLLPFRLLKALGRLRAASTNTNISR